MALDETSVEIGTLRADMRHIANLYSGIDGKLEKLLDSMVSISMETKANTHIIRDITDEENGILTIAAAKAHQASEDIKKGKWVLTGVGLSGVFGGTYLGSWLSKISSVIGTP